MNRSPGRRRCLASGSTSPRATNDDLRVQVVRSLDTAFAEFGVTPGEFEPLPAD
jgi:hypothetical protein